MHIPRTFTRVQELETLGVLAAVSLLLGLAMQRQWLCILALILLLVGLFLKPVARMVTRGWLTLSIIIGTFNSKVILSLVFYFFLTPIAFLYRLFSKNPLRLRGDGASSWYVDRNYTYSRADFEKMW